jgi:Carboxypeptidase regulatory-like domain/TonB dependent receptor/TonB-dependent Receptor Plug Domain
MKRLIVVLMAWVVVSGTTFAQGVQTGALRGRVSDTQNRPVSGMTVTVSSPSLQGTRSAVTDSHGLYSLAALPAGAYELHFVLAGFAPVTRSVVVLLGLSVLENVTMRAEAVTETVNVVAPAASPIASPVVGANFKHDEIEALATPRTLSGIAQLSPGVTENGPQNNGQLVINGAFAFDNVFMVNGVDVNHNLFAQPQNLFIEEAIDETQVLTSGISAEYGRFTGGVVNAVTKSGGNTFAGSWRVNFSNPAWTTATPFQVARGTAAAAHPDSLQSVHEGTLGGPIVKDRLWFFGAMRYGSIDSTITLPQTGAVLPTNDLNTRVEVKLTGRIADGRTLQGGFLTDPRTRTNNSGAQSLVISPDSEVTRRNPNWYFFTNYHQVLASGTFLELQFSQQHFKTEADGGTSADLTKSPILSATQCACLYNAPYLDATDPTQFNNRQLTGSLTSLWNLAGRHETKAGYEFFLSQAIGGNSQSSTSYVFSSDFLTDAAGLPVADANGHLIPVFAPGVSAVDFYPATRGAIMDTNHQSLYLQDQWALGARLSASLGARFERVNAVSTGDVVSARNNRIVPRLAAAYDLAGNGRRIIHATYGWYSGRYDEAQIGANSPFGHPADLTTVYTGPAGQGVNFAPGFNLANYPVGASSSALVPLANVLMSPDLRTPLVREFTASYGENLSGGRGYAEAAYIHRRTFDLIEDFQTVAGGFTNVTLNGLNVGRFTNLVYQNTNAAHRVYDALVFQSRYRLSHNWTLAGHYTTQLRNDGNYEGEAGGQPGKTSFIGNYPEAFNAARNFPDGHLQDFQRHRLRIWSVYNTGMGRYGDVSVSGLWRVDSALTYSLRAISPSLSATQRALIAQAGYPDSPQTAGPTSGYFVFFGARGSESFKGYGLFDTSINYGLPILRTLRPWVKLDVFNVLDNRKLIAWNVTVKPDAASAKDSLGLATGYTPGATFGTATGNTINLTGLTVNAYPVAFNGALAGGRTVRVAVGIKF